MQPTEGKNNNFCLKYIYETTVQQNSESDLNAALDLWPCGSVWHCSHWNYFVSAKCKISSQDSNGHMIIPQQFIREEVWLVAFIEYFNFTKHRGTAMVNILVIMVRAPERHALLSSDIMSQFDWIEKTVNLPSVPHISWVQIGNSCRPQITLNKKTKANTNF